jgi:hypothetical protein
VEHSHTDSITSRARNFFRLKISFIVLSRLAALRASTLLRNAAGSSERVVVRQRRNPNPHRTNITLATDFRRFCRQRCFSSVPSAEEQEHIFLTNTTYHGRRVLRAPTNAAEREWLQPGIDVLSTESIQSSPRFDWRLTAKSRSRKPRPVRSELTDGKSVKYVRRMQPPRIDVGWNEPYYGAIQTYSKRYVAFALVYINFSFP